MCVGFGCVVLQHYQYCWIVDPIDGTKEFIKRNGEFTVMIGLLQVGGTRIGQVGMLLPPS